MKISQRLAGLLWKRRTFLATACCCGAATLVLLLAGHGAGTGANAASAPAAVYAALNSQEASGLTLVTSHSTAPATATPHPTWPLNAPEGASPHWPDSTTIRRLPLPVPGLSGWIAASLEGGICILLYDGEAVNGNAAVYSSCSAEGRLDRGASVDIREIPGKPGVVIDAGVVPNDVTAVTETLADGNTETLSVHDNAWARQSEQPTAAGQAPAWTTGG